MASRIPNPFAKPVKTGKPVIPNGLIPVGEAMAEKYRRQKPKRNAPNRSK